MARRRTDVVIAVAAALVLASCTASPSEPADAPGASQPATTDGVLAMAQPRAVHRATTLHDGRVLITGGCTARFCEDFDSGRVSELFDPASGRLAAGPEALEPRASGTATLLRDGRVLLTGGYPGEGRDPASGMEAFEPAAERFSSVGDMTTGAFSETLGRTGASLLSYEDTAMIERVVASGWEVWLRPSAVVDHTVSAERCRGAYWRRSWWNGISRARHRPTAVMALKRAAAVPLYLGLYALRRDRIHLYRTAESCGYAVERLRVRARQLAISRAALVERVGLDPVRPAMSARR